MAPIPTAFPIAVPLSGGGDGSRAPAATADAASAAANGATTRITDDDRVSFYRNGFLVRRNVVPQALVDRALRKINQTMLDPTPLLQPASAAKQAEEWQRGTHCLRASSSKEITDLFNASDVKALVSELIGINVRRRFFGQIALRRPGAFCTDNESFVPAPWWEKSWHIDGVEEAKRSHDGMVLINNFTMLVGVVLSPVRRPMCGNFCTVKRSHLVIEEHFQKSGFDEILARGLQGLPPLPLARPEQLIAEPGDLIMCHYQMAHTIAPNTSPHIRYATYFRVDVRRESGRNPGDAVPEIDARQPMLNIWADWPAMAEVVHRERIAGASFSTGHDIEVRGPASAVAQARAAEAKWAAEDVQRLSDRTEANRLFEAKAFARAAPLFEKLAKNSANDIEVMIKAGGCINGNPRASKADRIRGRAYLERAADLLPTNALPAAMLAHNRVLCKEWKAALLEVLRFFDRLKSLDFVLPSVGGDPKENEHVCNLVKLGVGVLTQLRRQREVQPLINRACVHYPGFASAIRRAGANPKW